MCAFYERQIDRDIERECGERDRAWRKGENVEKERSDAEKEKEVGSVRGRRG